MLSPPPRIDWGLRDYGTAEWVGGSIPLEVVQNENGDCTTHVTRDGKKTLCGRTITLERWFFHWKGQPFREDLVDCGRCRDKIPTVECDHVNDSAHQKQGATSARAGRSNVEAQRNEVFRDVCGKCGAQRIDSQIGLEKTPEEFVAELVGVFREVWRVLRDDGTLWVNLGDSYNAGTSAPSVPSRSADVCGWTERSGDAIGSRRVNMPGLKPKDLCGIPWRVAFELQADGWYLRQEIIWHKPAPMPESVRDRCTKAHEHIFLLTKRPRYYYDAEAVKEGESHQVKGAFRVGGAYTGNQSFDNSAQVEATDSSTHTVDGGRNKRSVWTINTQPFSGAHFATFPPALVEPCILAGTSAKGACPACGAPWVRIVEKPFRGDGNPHTYEERATVGSKMKLSGKQLAEQHAARPNVEIGWQPSCECNAGEPVPCIVLDPFGGAGTTAIVAEGHGRDWILCELNESYANDIAWPRIRQGWSPVTGKAKTPAAIGQKTLFTE